MADYLRSWRRNLEEQGYSNKAIMLRLYAVGKWARETDWSSGKSAGACCLSIERHSSTKKNTRYYRDNKKFARLFVQHLHELGVIGPLPEQSLSPAEKFIKKYACYLKTVRNLAEASIDARTRTAITFMREKFGEGRIYPSQLTSEVVANYVRRHARDHGAEYTKLLVCGLRIFLRYMFVTRFLRRDISAAVPKIPVWRLASLPHYISPEKIQKVVRSCGTNSLTKRRDRAILILLQELGLRAGEVANLNLEDIDWVTGAITITGKGSSGTLPLPARAGAAIADYLRCDRKDCRSRRVFITVRAPMGGFQASSSIGTIVKRAFIRARVAAPFRGAHVMRHSLATHMIRRGATLDEIGSVLRHKDPDTTAIYAKIDLRGLRKVALPWPKEVKI